MLRKPSNLKWKLPLFLLGGGVLLAWVVLRVPCPFRSLTGLLCPGCGMGRAWLSCLRLDLANAFYFHPMFWSVPVLAIFLLYDCKPFRRERYNTLTLSVILLGLFICYVIRLAVFLCGRLPI